MAYDSTIPATGHSASQDYNGIRGNFQQIQTSFSVDHEPLASGGGIDGFHKKSTYVGGSDPLTVAGSGIVYTKSANSDINLFYKSGGGVISQLTGGSIVANPGFAFIGGILMQWGFINIPNGIGAASANFAIPFPTNVFSITVTPSTNNLNNVFACSWTVDPTRTTLSIGRTGLAGTVGHYYIAIGN